MKIYIFPLILLFSLPSLGNAYPFDGYESTGIRRLLRLQRIMEGTIKDSPLVAGAQSPIGNIKLNLLGEAGEMLGTLPDADPELQKSLNSLFPSLSESYGMILLDITPGRTPRFAQRKQKSTYSPGSVGKLAILVGLFTELKKLYPDSFEKRQALLKTQVVKAGPWCITNEHTVPFYFPENNQFYKRPVQPQDEFSLYEWVDHMVSVSSNAAASIVWREVILMRAFGAQYPVTQAEADEFFAMTPKNQLTDWAVNAVNEPLCEMGIQEVEWRLGSLFTSQGKKLVPGRGGSIGSPLGLMKFLVAMERGKIVDAASSLEIKRILYSTDRRIRYAASSSLKEGRVYFKSGSLYKCRAEAGGGCGKYMGNVENYMNSVAVVEQPDGRTYLVVLMSNVLRKNSANDHAALASRVDALIQPQP